MDNLTNTLETEKDDLNSPVAAINCKLKDDINQSIINEANANQPLTLPSCLPDVIPFNPAIMLPEQIRNYVADVADRQQSPPDFVAVAALCGLSALVGKKIQIRPKQHDEWTITAPLWGAIIGRPSAMKSPSMKEALKPLTVIGNAAAEHFETELREYAINKEFSEIEKNAAKDIAKSKIKKGNRESALAEYKQAQFLNPQPLRRRYVVNDATVEKLGELLNENPNGLALVRDELSGWLSKMGREEFQCERAFYLECFDGNGQFTYDRIGRGTIDIRNCILSVIGGIQPSKIARLIRDTLNGSKDDGLLQRLQLAVWPDDVNGWRWNDRAPDADALKQYQEVFELLHAIEIPPANMPTPYLKFTESAQKLFIAWMEDLQQLARANQLHPAFESYLLKMPKTIASLALIFELIAGGRQSVGDTAIRYALEWATYLKSHAERIYSIANNMGVEGANTILAKKDKLPDPFSARDVQRKGWGGLGLSVDVAESLACLVDYNHLIEIQHQPGLYGGRPRINYQWNKILMENA
jgi:hypothetical protein